LRQVKKIIARMRAAAIVEKLQRSIKSDDSFVHSVEVIAQKATSQ
jgi:hypothetical protein